MDPGRNGVVHSCWSVFLAAALDCRISRLCLEGLRPSILPFVNEYMDHEQNFSINPELTYSQEEYDWPISLTSEWVVPKLLTLCDIVHLAAASRSGLMILDPRGSDEESICDESWQKQFLPDWQKLAPGARIVCRPKALERSRQCYSFLKPKRVETLS